MKSKVYWHRFGYLPGWFGFCPDERAWKREMRRMNCVEPYPTTDARMTTFTKDGKLAMIVTVAHHIDGMDDPNAIIGLLVHEAVHVFQQVCLDIGERTPSAEMEAYAIQHISMNLVADYDESGRFNAMRGKKNGRKK